MMKRRAGSVKKWFPRNPSRIADREPTVSLVIPPSASLANHRSFTHNPAVDARTVEFLTLLGYLYLRHGQGARAVTALEAARVFRRGDLQLSRALAYAYLAAGRFNDCLAAVDSLPTRGDGQLTLIRSRALWGLGRQDEARRAMASVTGDLRSSNGG
jgi:hypothetical protein